MLCQLCLKNKNLCASHIIPEFFYKPLYDDIHRYLQFSTKPNEKNIYRQKGIWEKLLCENCEQYFSGLEDYARRVLFGGTEIKISQQKGKIVITNLDYAKFKLFQLSLLWRAGATQRSEFSKVSLGPHQDKLRLMLISHNPGEAHKYGCILTATPRLSELLNEFMMAPDSIKVDGHHCYRFLFGFILWVYFVSSHTNRLPGENLFLSGDGSLPIFFENNKSIKFIQKIVDQIKAAGK
jgi:hypothetical protein